MSHSHCTPSHLDKSSDALQEYSVSNLEASQSPIPELDQLPAKSHILLENNLTSFQSEIECLTLRALLLIQLADAIVLLVQK